MLIGWVIFLSGYWTDNGAYYYYKTLEGLNYEDTLIELRKNLNELQIPARYLEVFVTGSPEWNVTRPALQKIKPMKCGFISQKIIMIYRIEASPRAGLAVLFRRSCLFKAVQLTQHIMAKDSLNKTEKTKTKTTTAWKLITLGMIINKNLNPSLTS